MSEEHFTYRIKVHRQPVVEQASGKLGAVRRRTKAPTETRELDAEVNGPKVYVDFGPLIGTREFSISAAGRGQCCSPGMWDWIIDAEDVKRLRKRARG